MFGSKISVSFRGCFVIYFHFNICQLNPLIRDHNRVLPFSCSLLLTLTQSLLPLCNCCCDTRFNHFYLHHSNGYESHSRFHLLTSIFSIAHWYDDGSWLNIYPLYFSSFTMQRSHIWVIPGFSLKDCFFINTGF